MTLGAQLISTLPVNPLGRYQQLLLVLSASIAGFAIPISTAAQNIGTALLLLCFLGMAPLRSQLGKTVRMPFVLTCLALYLVIVLGTLWSQVSWGERVEMLTRMRAYLLAPIFVACMTHPAGRNSLIGGFCAGVMVNVLISVGMATTGIPILHGVDGNYSAFRTHTYHNLFISWVAIGLLASLLWGNIKSRNVRIGIFLILAIFIIDALFLVRGRSAQILLLMMLGLLCLRRWGLRAILPTLIGTAVLLPTLYLTSPVIRNGTSLAIQDMRERSQGQSGETSVGLRLEFAENTLKIIREAPVLGMGTGSFSHNYRQVTGFTKATHGQRASHNPHNDYLWLWSEIGLLGALGLIGILLAFVHSARRLPEVQRVSMEAIALSMLVGTLANSFFTDNISGVGFMVVACALVAGPLRLAEKAESA